MDHVGRITHSLKSDLHRAVLRKSKNEIVPAETRLRIIAGIPQDRPAFAVISADFYIIMIRERVIKTIFQNLGIHVIIKFEISGIID